MAFEVYARGLEEGHFSRERLTIIDYSLPSYEKRLWVIDAIKGGPALWISFPDEEWLDESEFLDED